MAHSKFENGGMRAAQIRKAEKREKDESKKPPTIEEVHMVAELKGADRTYVSKPFNIRDIIGQKFA